MGDVRYLTVDLILDASPLIYLAKLEALDVLAVMAERSFVTPTVLEEVTRPQVAYRHPDAVEIEAAVQRGDIDRLVLTKPELARAAAIAERVPGLHAGETEMLAPAIERSLSAVIFERRAQRVARSLGAGLVDVVELLVGGTADSALMEERILRFAGMVNMKTEQVIELLAQARSDRLTREIWP